MFTSEPNSNLGCNYLGTFKVLIINENKERYTYKIYIDDSLIANNGWIYVGDSVTTSGVYNEKTYSIKIIPEAKPNSADNERVGVHISYQNTEVVYFPWLYTYGCTTSNSIIERDGVYYKH